MTEESIMNSNNVASISERTLNGSGSRYIEEGGEHMVVSSDDTDVSAFIPTGNPAVTNGSHSPCDDDDEDMGKSRENTCFYFFF